MINFFVHVSTFLCIGMMIVVMRRTFHSPVRTAFLIALGCGVLWDVSTVLELDYRLITGNTCMLFINICYIAICLVPVAILYMGNIILHPEWRLKPAHAVFLVIPFASIIMVFTNPQHQLFFVNFSLNSSEAVYGAYFYFHSLYSYACVAVGIVFMYTAAIRNSGFFSRQSLFIILGILAMLVPNLLFSFGLVHNLPFSINAAATSVTILCFAFAFLKYRFITSLPITLKQVVDLISDGYLVVDRHLCILSYNRALLNLLPQPAHITLSENLRTFVERYFLDTPYDLFVELQAQSVAQRGTASMESSIGEKTCINVEITPVMQHNTQIGSIILFKDITQSKMLIEVLNSHNQDLEAKVEERTIELHIAKEKAEESDRLKSAFLANVSHEIRTPLNGITGFLFLLSSDNLSPKLRKEYINIINGCSAQLVKLIDDIVDLSKIEAKQMTINPVPVKMNDLMKELWMFYDKYMKINNKNNVELILDESEFIDHCVTLVDPVRLRQVLNSLLDNAIKFTEKGFIRFGYRQTNQDQLEFEVKDTGIGLSPELHEVIFERFRQTELTNSRFYRGTGIGLYIARNLVQMMGGDMRVESTEGNGASFYFTILYLPVKLD